MTGTRSQDVDKALKEHDKAINEVQNSLVTLMQQVAQSLQQQEQILAIMKEKSDSSVGFTSGIPFGSFGDGESRGPRPMRVGKVEFPRFSGEDVEAWLYRCEHFFTIDETPDSMKLRYAVIHLEEEAIQWHQAFMRTRGATVVDLPWADYVRVISTRFSNAMFEDPLEELALLSQTGSLKEYNTAFDSLLNKVTLSESQAVSLYLKGLQDEIRGPVKMFKPGTLHEAYGLVKIQDLNDASVDKRIKMAEGSSGFPKGEGDTTRILPPTNASNLPLLATPRMAPNVITKPPQQRLTSKELEEKRAKGECFWCSEKYVPGHKCGRNRHQVYIIEAKEEDAQEIEPGIDTWKRIIIFHCMP